MVFLQMELMQLGLRLPLLEFEMKKQSLKTKKKMKRRMWSTHKKNSDRDNSPIVWPDSLPASPRAAINDSISDTLSKDGNPDLQSRQDTTQDALLSSQGTTSFSQKTSVFLLEKSGLHVSISVQGKRVTKKATVSAYRKKNQFNIWFTTTKKPKRKK